jgi:hypothetical protein
MTVVKGTETLSIVNIRRSWFAAGLMLAACTSPTTDWTRTGTAPETAGKILASCETQARDMVRGRTKVDANMAVDMAAGNRTDLGGRGLSNQLHSDRNAYDYDKIQSDAVDACMKLRGFQRPRS